MKWKNWVVRECWFFPRLWSSDHWGVVKGELRLFTCSVLMYLLLCLRVWRLYINVIFCCCGCLWDYYFNAFDCLNNFLSLTLSSRTSPFWKRLISFFGVGLPQTMCVFVCKRAVTQHTCFKKYSLFPLVINSRQFNPNFPDHSEQKHPTPSITGSSISAYQSGNKITERTNSENL